MISFIKIIESKSGKMFISILLGLGLATLFRKVCHERNCFVFKHPDINDINKTTYKYDNKCFVFKEKAVKCNSNKKIVN